jgi:predicted DNA-binding protein (UPF0251 family)
MVPARFNTVLYYSNSLNSSPQALSDLSSLTRIQVETIKLHRDVLKGEINMDIALKMRKNMGISRGTHYRILAQAKKNVKESLFTVAIAVQMGLLDVGDVSKLISAVSVIPEEVDPEKLPQIMALVTALASHIVML